MDLQVILRIREPDCAILNSGLKHHGAGGKCAQLRQLLIIEIPDAQVTESSQLALVLLPPDLRRPAVLGKERHLFRLGAGFLDASLLR